MTVSGSPGGGIRRVRPLGAALATTLAAVAVLVIGALLGIRWAEVGEGPAPGGDGPGDGASGTSAPTPDGDPRPQDGQRQDQQFPALRWAPPSGWQGFEELRLPPEGGRVRLDDRTDYRVVAPEPVTGPLEIIGGRHLVWRGGHIRIEADDGGEPHRRGPGLLVRDGEHARQGRVVHLEGILLDGGGLTEGVNLDAPSATVQIENVRVEEVRFVSADDRDGTGPYEDMGRNHPDVLQTYGGHRELRIDGLTGRSGYQGLFLKVDHADGRGGPAHLRRVDLRAITSEGVDGVDYAGNRMFFWDAKTIGDLHLEQGTVWLEHHPDAGKVAAAPNPREGAGRWWRGAYRDGDELRTEKPPGTAQFTDVAQRLAAGERVIEPRTGRDAVGDHLWWPIPDTGRWAAVLDADGLAPGRIYDGTPPTGSYVPRDLVGVGYRPPGYEAEGNVGVG